MMQSPVPATVKATLRAIRVLFYTMIIGMLLFSIAVFALNFLQEQQITDKAEADIFLFAAIAIAAGGIIVAQKIHNKRINEIQNSGMKLIGKLEAYRASLILYMALREGGLFAVIVYYMTANKWLLIVFGVVLLSMWLRRPEKSKIFNELQLSSEEQAELN